MEEVLYYSSKVQRNVPMPVGPLPSDPLFGR